MVQKRESVHLILMESVGARKDTVELSVINVELDISDSPTAQVSRNFI